MGKNNILKKIVEILSLKNASKTNGVIILVTSCIVGVFFTIIACFEILDDIVIPLLIIVLLLIVWGVVILLAGNLKVEQIKEEERRKNREIYKKQLEEKRQQELERKKAEQKVRDEKMAEISDLWPYGTQRIPIAKEATKRTDDDEVIIGYICLMAQLDWRDDKYILNIFHESIEDKTEYTVAIKPSGMFALKDGQAYRISKERLQLDSTFIVCSKESNSKIGDVIALASSFENMQTIRSADIPNDEELLEMMQKYHFSMNRNILHCSEYNIAEVLVDALVEAVLDTQDIRLKDNSDSEVMLFKSEMCSLFYKFSKINRIADEDYKERIGNEKIALINYINKHQSYQFGKLIQEHGWRRDTFWPYFSIVCKYFVSLINKGSVRLQIDVCTLNDNGSALVRFYMPFDETLWNEVSRDKRLLNDSQRELFNLTHEQLADRGFKNPTVEIFFERNKIKFICFNEKEKYRVVDDIPQ